MIYEREVETAIIACVLSDNNLLLKCEITKDLFYNPVHGEMWEEIQEIYKKNNTVDATMLKNISEAVRCLNEFYVQSNFNIYKNKLLELKHKRDLIKLSDDIKLNIYSRDEVIDVKTKILNDLNNIVLQKSTKKNKLCEALLENTEILERRYNGEQVYYKWGIDCLDKATGGVYPTYSILSARPSVGKTAFSLQLSKNVAKQGGKIAYFSLETETNQIVNRLIASEGVSKDTLDKLTKIKDLDWSNYSRAVNGLHDLKINIYDDATDIETILLRAEEQRADMGLDLLVLDYIQLTDSKRNFGTQNEKVSYISRQLKLYQQKTGVAVLALSQFNREAERNETPTLANLRDSGSLEQDARLILFLYEDKKNEETIKNEHQEGKKQIVLRIAKNSEGERDLFKRLNFYGSTQKFYE